MGQHRHPHAPARSADGAALGLPAEIWVEEGRSRTFEAHDPSVHQIFRSQDPPAAEAQSPSADEQLAQERTLAVSLPGSRPLGAIVPEVMIAGGGPAGAVAALMLPGSVFPSRSGNGRRKRRTRWAIALPPIPIHCSTCWTCGHASLPVPTCRLMATAPPGGPANRSEHHFISEKHGAGWRLDRRVFEETLASAAMSAGVCWNYGSRMAAAEWTATGGGFRWSREVWCSRTSPIF